MLDRICLLTGVCMEEFDTLKVFLFREFWEIKSHNAFEYSGYRIARGIWHIGKYDE